MLSLTQILLYFLPRPFFIPQRTSSEIKGILLRYRNNPKTKTYNILNFSGK